MLPAMPAAARPVYPCWVRNETIAAEFSGTIPARAGHCTVLAVGWPDGAGELEALGDGCGAGEWVTCLLEPPTWRAAGVLCRPALALYWFRLSVAGPAASSDRAVRSRTWWVKVAVGAELNARSLICGAAARAPITATAGAALPARWATFPACEGAECRPDLRIFLLAAYGLPYARSYERCEPKYLPNDGSPPSYSALSVPLTRPDTTSIRQHARALGPMSVIPTK